MQVQGFSFPHTNLNVHTYMTYIHTYVLRTLSIDMHSLLLNMARFFEQLSHIPATTFLVVCDSSKLKTEAANEMRLIRCDNFAPRPSLFCYYRQFASCS